MAASCGAAPEHRANGDPSLFAPPTNIFGPIPNAQPQPQELPPFAQGGFHPSQFGLGNIDLWKRPVVWNPDGSFSTLESMSFQDQSGQEILVPTITQNGRRMTQDEAIQHYRAALSVNPSYAPAHNNLGAALAARGDLGGAIDEYRKAVELKPDYAEAHNNLGGALFFQAILAPGFCHSKPQDQDQKHARQNEPAIWDLEFHFPGKFAFAEIDQFSSLFAHPG
jgi:hypothetical protein